MIYYNITWVPTGDDLPEAPVNHICLVNLASFSQSCTGLGAICGYRCSGCSLLSTHGGRPSRNNSNNDNNNLVIVMIVIIVVLVVIVITVLDLQEACEHGLRRQEATRRPPKGDPKRGIRPRNHLGSWKSLLSPWKVIFVPDPPW